MPAGGYHENARQWGPRESLHLLELVETHGNRWREIGARLGRTPSSARNRHARIENQERPIQKRGVRAQPNTCRVCGLPRRGHVCVQQLECVFPPHALVEGKSPSETVACPELEDSAAFVEWLLADEDAGFPESVENRDTRQPHTLSEDTA